ncbi:MAG: twin-arginine translocase subunit TatC [Actinomycetota bacterium]
MSVFARIRRRPPEERAGTMTLVEHLEELRHRLVICILAVAGGAVVGWFLYGPVLNLILNPYCDYWETTDPKLRINETCSLFFNEPLGAMIVKLKIVVFIGLAVALPVLLYQLWAFIVPGLTKKERRMAIPFVASSVVLFAIGAFFAYITLPKGLQFLLGFAGDKFSAILTGDRFVSFVILVAVAFGLAFEFPVLLVFLEMVGVLSTQSLRKWRRYSILGIAIFAAIITPSSDPYTMLAMTVPMCLFYEAAIIIGRLMKK